MAMDQFSSKLTYVFELTYLNVMFCIKPLFYKRISNTGFTQVFKARFFLISLLTLKVGRPGTAKLIVYDYGH